MSHRIHLFKALLTAVKNGIAKTSHPKTMAIVKEAWKSTENSAAKYKNKYIRFNVQCQSTNEEIREFIF